MCPSGSAAFAKSSKHFPAVLMVENTLDNNPSTGFSCF